MGLREFSNWNVRDDKEEISLYHIKTTGWCRFKK